MSASATTAASRTTIKAYRRAAAKVTPRLSPTSLSLLADEMERAQLPHIPTSVFAIPTSVRTNPYVLYNTDGTSSHPYRHDSEATPSSNTEERKNPGAVVRSIGTARRVFILNSAFTPSEMDGLAYRLGVMSTNDAINSVLLANPLEDAELNGDMSNNVTVLPTFMEEDEPGKHLDARLNKALNYNNKGGSQSPFDSAGRKTDFIKSILNETFGNGHASPYVSCGYDARYVYESGLLGGGGGGGGSGGMTTDTKQRIDTELLSPMMKLSNSVRGSTTHHHNLDGVGGGRKSKVPIISFPHGLVTDGGYSLLLSSYVLATYSTSYRVLHPLRGLAFDPCGLSYLLPRIGQEFHQASSKYSMSIAAMLSLTGYEANAQDMIATGLATHYVGGPYKLNLLERALMDINSREYQNLHPKPSGLYGREDDWGGETDINLHFHNVAVGNLIQNLSEYDAAGADEYGCYLSDMLDDETGLYLKDKDPSLTLAEDRVQLYGELESDLVNWAATFASAFANENTVPGILARLREIAATKAQFVNKLGYEEDVEVADMAQSLIHDMERRSPLALCVTNRLLRLGAEHGETMELCMERERQSQAKLYMKADGDYVRWARSGSGVGLVYMPHGSASLFKDKEDTYGGGWTHKSVGDVTEDEIDEIVGM